MSEGKLIVMTPGGKTLDLFPVLDSIRDDALFLSKEIKALKKQIAEMSELKYVGTHQNCMSYNKNNIVTHSGCLWICCKSGTSEKPGSGTDFQMITKGGK